MLARPTPSEERWLALATRYPALRAPIVADGRTGGWTVSGWPSRLLQALLGLGAAVAIQGALLWLPATGLVAGLAMLLLAELLLARRRVLRSGLEDALHACGVVALIFGLVDGSPEAAGVALLALTLFASGLRLLNAAVTTVAALVASLAVALAARESAATGLAAVPAALACTLGALLVLVAGGRSFLRPSHDRMLDGLVLALPVSAWGWATLAASRDAGLAVAASGWRGQDGLPALLALGLGAACLVTGLRRRSHAALFAALACAAGFAHALRDLLPVPGHAQWIGWGLLLLALAMALERTLRKPRRGLGSGDLGEDTGTLELSQLAAAAALPRAAGTGGELAAGAPGPEPVSAATGQGGQFGGGGATGRY
jgi:hypothetical protein